MRGESHQAAHKSSDEKPGEVMRLRSIVAAQKWDIEGLTEQRDALLRAAAERDETVAALESRIAAQQREQTDSGTAVTALREVKRASGLAFRLVADVLDLLPAMLGAQDQPSTAFVARLLATLGLIDVDFYRRQSPVPIEGIDPAEHYLQHGEAAGLAPNILFDPHFYHAQISPYETLPAGLLVHYLLHGWRLGLSPHPLFDAEYYAGRHVGETAADINPLLHFIRIGAPAGYAPHPLVNPDYYVRQTGDGIGGNTAALLEHFLTTGWRAGLTPSPLFDTEFYTSRNPEVVEQGWNPLLHYLCRGDAEGRMPNIGFDPAYYRSQAGRESGLRGCALAHYITRGHRQGLWPSPLFDPEFYFHANPDARRSEKSALEHYLEHGRHEDRDFHPLIDRRYFLGQAQAIARGNTDCLRLLVSEPLCRNLSPTPFFDAEHYLARYPEAGSAREGAFEHFLRFGAAAGYDPHPLFSTQFYGRQVDWRARSRDPLSDYLRFGVEERSSPHPLFDGKAYLERYDDIARDRANPLLHYLVHGGRGEERRSPHPLFDAVSFLEKLDRLPNKPHLQEFLSLPLDALVDPHPLFDCYYYLRQKPEIAVARINPLLHYITSPAGQGANPHPLFEEQFYLSQRPDLAGGETSLLVHYLQEGYKEYISPHPWFDSYYVSEQYPDLVSLGKAPLVHYLSDYRRDFNGGVMSRFDPVSWFDGISYNILYQDSDPEAESPLLHFITHSAGFRAPADVPRRPLKRDETSFNENAKPKFSVRELTEAASLLIDRSDRYASDALIANRATRFVSSHNFYIEGAIPKGRETPRQIALYAIHSASGNLNATHRATLEALRKKGYASVIINSTLENGHAFLSEAKVLAEIVVLRKPGGRDFASWMASVAMLWSQISEAEHWLFINDSLLGPINDLDLVWRKFANSSADLWALTDSLEQAYHLQSSFFILRRSAFLSRAFFRYVLGYEFPEDRVDIVRQGEIGFSATMTNSTNKVDVMVPYTELTHAWLAQVTDYHQWLEALTDATTTVSSPETMIASSSRAAFVRFAERWLQQTEDAIRRGEPRNPQHHFWDILIDRFNYPFIKRDLLMLNPCCVPTVPRLFDLVNVGYRSVLTASLADAPDVMIPENSILRVSRKTLIAWEGLGKGTVAVGRGISRRILQNVEEGRRGQKYIHA